MSVTPTEDRSPAAVGIDLGTTNSAVAWAGERGRLRLFEVPQLVSAGEVRRLPSLPSFLYMPDEAERAAGTVTLPWDRAPSVAVGIFAREQGALLPARQIASAKSWLANPAVDRTAKLLPWGFEDGPHLSPVEASTRILAHIRDAWNHGRGREGGAFERQPIVLTVPASFDEEARELTVRAAREAGFENLTLLEEPLAALYAWIAARRREAGRALEGGGLVLVCDVGGGTTDFSLIRADVEDGDLRFERIAIGEHLLLGGDNLDLALAVLVEARLAAAGAPKLTLAQRQHLRRRCSAAKEALLAPGAPDRVRITMLGAGRGVIGGGTTAELMREEAVRALADGFLPMVAAVDHPARDRRVALRELGLPYETEPAITRHLAAFLARAARAAGRDGLARPDAVLFNGGFFTPSIARQRILEVLAAWFGEAPHLLDNDRPEAAVGMGAAFYGWLRQNPDAAKRLLIRAGSARAYYVGVEASGADGLHAICVMPRRTQEGTSAVLERRFTVMTNRPLAFTLYSSTQRTDPVNALVRFAEADEVHRHAPLVTVLRFGKRSRSVELEVALRATFTETGTLELWCESQTTDHRWRLSFNLRGIESAPFDVEDATEPDAGGDQVLVSEDSLERAVALIRRTFGTPASGAAPETLTGELENAIGHGKHAWPLGATRRLADALLESADGRRRAPAFEARWLNLAGFCARPGFGTALDAWRVSELRKVYASGLSFPNEIQCQVEWLVLWQRVSAGFSAGQQRELAQRVSGQLGLGLRRPPRLNPQIEREGWRLLGSLERLDPGQRTRLGDELLDRIRREPRHAAWLWTIGRLGARAPFYGPLSSVVPAAVAGRWIERLLTLRAITVEAAIAIAQIGARTDDPARDISDETRAGAVAHLSQTGVDRESWRSLTDVLPPDGGSAVRVFGESLPEGLRLQAAEVHR